MNALGDPTRRAIFERLADGPRAVGEIADEMPVSRPAVSQHLKVLKDAGLVGRPRDGTRRLYRLDPGGVGALRAYFDAFWTQALAAFKEAVENPTEDRMMEATEHAVRREITVQAPPGARIRGVHRAHRHAGGRAATASARRSSTRWSSSRARAAAGYERGVDGSECVWGEVLAYEPPGRLVLSWRIGGDWQLEDAASEIEVTFTPAGDGAPTSRSSTATSSAAPPATRCARRWRRRRLGRSAVACYAEAV